MSLPWLALAVARPATTPAGAQAERHGLVEVVMDHIADSRTVEFQMPWGPKYELTPRTGGSRWPATSST